MTKEELNKLKPGDEIFIRARYTRLLDDGDVRFSCPVTDERGKETPDVGFAHPSHVILPPPAPKYDPCRKLKQGDKVKPCIWHDRVPSARLGATRFIPKQRTYEVFSDELHEFVKLISGDDVVEMHVCHLELVTPVEELEPYSVEGDEDEWDIILDNKVLMSFPFDSSAYYTQEQAKEAAEAECARLNAEHRKEQK